MSYDPLHAIRDAEMNCQEPVAVPGGLVAPAGVEPVGGVVPPPYVNTAHSAQEVEQFADAQENPDDDIFQVQVVQLSASRGRFEPEGIEFALAPLPSAGVFRLPFSWECESDTCAYPYYSLICSHADEHISPSDVIHTQWRVVTAGRKVGIWPTSLDADDFVTGVSGAQRLSFDSYEAASRYYQGNKALGRVVVLPE